MMLTIQLIGLLALLLDVGSLQLKYRKHILIVQILASLSWVLHFFFLGAITGAAMNGVGIIRSLMYYKWHNLKVLSFVIVLSVLVTFLTWNGPTSLLPMVAMILAAVAFWQRAEQVIRLLLICCVPLWFTYNLIFGSYAGMASDCVALVSACIALYRYRKQGLRPALNANRHSDLAV